MNNLYRFYKQEKQKRYSAEYIKSYAHRRAEEVKEERMRLEEMKLYRGVKFNNSELQIGV